MNWFSAHLYLVTLLILGFMMIASGIVIREKASRPVTNAGNWSRVGGFSLFQQQYEPTIENPQNTVRAGEGEKDYSPITIQNSLSYQEASLPDEWQSLLQQLVQPEGRPTSAPESTDAYSFIPRGLISVTNPLEERTPIQEQLYEYGNRVGGFIREFDLSHTDMIPTLKDSYADRGNAEKRTAAERIGEDYKTLGKDIRNIQEVPPATASINLALARAYEDAGEKMILKLRTTSDEDFLKAMNVYNESVIQFTHTFVGLATYFSAAGVKFNESDAGSVFTFRSM